MGALFSKPDMPSMYNPYTYVPPAPAVNTPSAGDSAVDSDADGEEKNRIAAIVRRRSFPDTIQTSWRGVLQAGDWVPQRKNLLGE